MPKLIELEHIDAIARKMGRGVLYVEFPKCLSLGEDYVDWEKCEERKRIISWLDEAGIGWRKCAQCASDKVLSIGYIGHIYIDLPYDTANADYQKLADFLETPDGKMKIEGGMFYYLPLEVAMKNKHHDEPGYWEKRIDGLFGPTDSE